MEYVITPVDFSESSPAVASYAARLAQFMHADLVLLHFCSVPHVVGEIPVRADIYADVFREAERKMDTLVKSLEPDVVAEVKCLTDIRFGYLEEELPAYVEKRPDAIVVVQVHHPGSHDILTLETPAKAAINHLRCPVLIVPSKPRFEAIGKVGLACDMHTGSRGLPLQVVKRFVKEVHAQLHVYHVNTHSSGALRGDEVVDQLKISRQLEELHPRYHEIAAASVSETLKVIAEQEDIDMLVIIPKRTNWWSQMFRTTTTESLLKQIQIPLMTIHN